MTTQQSALCVESAQDRFDRLYITSGEICRSLNVSRPTVLQARRRKLLPDPIRVCGDAIYVWEREHVQPYLDAWRVILGVRRAAAMAQQTGQEHAA